MTLRYYERQIGDKIFHCTLTCETKEEAQHQAKAYRKKSFKIRVIPVKTYFDTVFQIFVYPEERRGVHLEGNDRREE